MTDHEREAQLRCGPSSGLPRGGDVAFVLRLLDEERTKNVQARAAAIEEVRKAVSELTFEGGDKSWSKLLVLRTIRALAPPQYPATGWLKQAQEVLDGTAPPQSEEGDTPTEGSRSNSDRQSVTAGKDRHPADTPQDKL